jgi:glyceraldehyde-3-phosphate dehydrogenase (NADP+)
MGSSRIRPSRHTELPQVPRSTPRAPARGAPEGPTGGTLAPGADALASPVAAEPARPAAALTPAVGTDPTLAARFPTLADLPAQHRVDPADNPPTFLIDGRVQTYEGERRPVYSKIAVHDGVSMRPLLLGYEAQLTENEALQAVASTEAAWGKGAGAWPGASPRARAEAVSRFADYLTEHTDRIATLLMYEVGKPRDAAVKEVTRSVEYIRDTLREFEALEAASQQPITGQNGKVTHHAREVRQPLGKVLCVAPFNYPINEFLTTIVPALLMGNVVIAKTPRFGMLATQAILEGFAHHFPPGAVSVLTGDGRVVIPPVMKAVTPALFGKGKPFVNVLAFIGGETAAEAILRSHPSPGGLHKILGLGAKNAAVLLPGADLDEVAQKLAKGALGFNGQRCTAEKMIFVPRAQAEAFAERLAAQVEGLKVGMPWEDGVAITPLPEDGKLEWMRGYIDDALAKGAQVINEGGGGAFHSLMRPAVLYPVSLDMKIAQEEQFGPIVPVVPYDDLAEVIAWQEGSGYGQQAGVWGPPEATAGAVAALGRLVARVNVNDVCQRGPDSFGFTATEKSGFGTLSLREALLAFSRVATVQSPQEGDLHQALRPVAAH